MEYTGMARPNLRKSIDSSQDPLKLSIKDQRVNMVNLLKKCPGT